MTLTLEQAQQVVAEARSAGVHTGPSPDTDSSLIEQAEDLVAMATQAFQSGAKGDAVVTLLRIAEVDMDLVGSPAIAEDPSEPQEIPEAQEDVSEAVAAVPKVEDYDSPHLRGALEFVVARRLPIPPDLEGESPEMPADLTTLGDREVRRLHSQFNALHVRAAWLLALEDSRLEDAKHLLKNARQNALMGLDRYDHEAGGRKTTAMMEAEADTDPSVIHWEGKVTEHTTNKRLLSQLADIYRGNVDRISRDWTMRSEERQYGAR